jgi:hypothetical protein
MALSLYLTLLLLCIVIGVEAMRRPAKIYQFPFGAAAVFLGFIVPPLFGLLKADYLPPWAMERYVFMCILCLAACQLGNSFGVRHPIRIARAVGYDASKWLVGAAVLISVGGLAYLKNRSLFSADLDTSTGVMVAVGFFATLLRYGFIMMVVHFLKTGNRYAFVLAGLAAMYYLDRIVFLGRRRDMIEFAFVLAGSIWLVKGRALPRLLVVGAIVLTTLFFASVGFYRSVAVSRSGEREWSRLKEIDLIGTFITTCEEGTSETIAGIYLTAAVAAEDTYDFGLGYWNALVFGYLPAQIVGPAVKQSFYLPLLSPKQLAERKYGFTPSTGSTVTGMVDCFGAFWYFGCLKFFLIAYVMQRLYRRAEAGNVMAQCLYLFLMTSALHAITHSTYWFLNAWIQIAFFWLPVMIYAMSSGVSSQSPFWRNRDAFGGYFPSSWTLPPCSAEGRQ